MKKTLVGSMAAMSLVACGGSVQTRGIDDSNVNPALPAKNRPTPVEIGNDEIEPDLEQQPSVGEVTGQTGGFVLADGLMVATLDTPGQWPLVGIQLSNQPNFCERGQQMIGVKNESFLFIDLHELDEEGNGVIPGPGVYRYGGAGDAYPGKFAFVYKFSANDVCEGFDRYWTVNTLAEVTITTLDPAVGAAGTFNVSFDDGASWMSGTFNVPYCAPTPEALRPAPTCQ